MKTQKNGQSGSKSTKSTDTSKKTQNLKADDLKKVKGGSGLLSGGNDLMNGIGGTGGLDQTSSGSGSQNGQSSSYSSNNGTTGNLGLVNE
jgi:hypothetical protein